MNKKNRPFGLFFYWERLKMNEKNLLTYQKTIKEVEDFITEMKINENKRTNKYLYHTINELLILLEIALRILKNKNP